MTERTARKFTDGAPHVTRSVTLPADTDRKVRALAKRTHRPIAQVIRDACADYADRSK